MDKDQPSDVLDNVIPFPLKSRFGVDHGQDYDLDSGEFDYPVEGDAFEEAQELCFDAFDTPNPKEKIALAIEALSIYQYCTDAWYLLGCHASRDPATKIGLFSNGVNASIRHYGADFFQGPNLWNIIEARPYMRCRYAFTETLWDALLFDKAVEEAEYVLAMDDTDHLGMRYLLLSWHLALGSVEDARDLIEEFDDDGSLEWLLGRMILSATKKGFGKNLFKFFDEIGHRNEHLLCYLRKEKKLPKSIPHDCIIGEESEAIIALDYFRHHIKKRKQFWLNLSVALRQFELGI